MKHSKGDRAPDFTLQNTEGNRVSLSDISKDRQIVLLFFPLAFSSTCTKELCTTRDNMKLYKSLNAEIIAISVDSFYTLRAFKKAQNLNFTLLSDFNKKVSQAYGVLNDDFFGMNGVSKRAAFVIDTNRTIQYAEVLNEASELPDFYAIEETLS